MKSKELLSKRLIPGIVVLAGIPAFAGCGNDPQYPEFSDDSSKKCVEEIVNGPTEDSTKRALGELSTLLDSIPVNENPTYLAWEVSDLLRGEYTGEASDPFVYSGESFEICANSDGNIVSLRQVANH